MNPNTEAIRQELEKGGNIAIAVSQRPNIDQMGGALALYLSLKESGKSVTVVSSGQPLVEVSNLVGIDKVKTTYDAQGSGDLTVTFPYKEGEIEKISYTLENGLLNIIVKAGEQGLNFNQNDVMFKRLGNAPTLLITVGVPRLSDLTSLFNLDSLKDTKILNIDNRGENQGYGDIVLVDPQASSVSEMVGDMMLNLNLRFDQDVAQNLLSGVSFATHNFSDGRTTPLAFEIASVAMKQGARRGGSVKPNTGTQSFPQRTQSLPAQPKINQPSPMQSIPQASNQIPQLSQNQQNPSNRGNIQRETQRENQGNTPPGDWLEPKIYKGSTNVG